MVCNWPQHWLEVKSLTQSVKYPFPIIYVKIRHKVHTIQDTVKMNYDPGLLQLGL